MNPAAWLAYLPPHLAADLLAHPTTTPLARALRQQAVALFADISGFTPMSEALGQVGPHGTEELSQILNRTFSTMIAIIHAYGGSIGKFAGDALTVVFPFPEQRTKNKEQKAENQEPGTRNQGTENQESRTKHQEPQQGNGLGHPVTPSPCQSPSASLRLCGATVRRAIQCALDMQAAMAMAAEHPTSAGTFRLTMKIGIGMGDLLTTTVGDPSIRLEYVLAGSAIDVCAAAEQHAAKGAVVLADTLLPLAGRLTTAPLLPPYQQVVRLHRRPAPSAPLPLADPSRAQRALLRRYLPPTIAERIAQGQQGFVDEHRTLTTLFVRFAGFAYHDPAVLGQLQRYLRDVVQISDRYGGYLRQVDVGDKGSLFIVLFGAPIAHEDDTERALFCALELRTIAQQHQITTTTGITTGKVFCGLIGSDVRREYAAIGDSINLAARLMSAAQPEQILVDTTTQAATRSTFHATRSTFQWSTLAPLRVKGKSVLVPVAVLERRKQRPVTRLRAPGYTLPMVGRQPELAQGHALIAQLLAGRGNLFTITAEAGMGKSRLAAEVLRHVSRLPVTYYTGECRSYGIHSSYHLWQPILQALFGLTSLPADQHIDHLRAHLAAIDPLLVERAPLLNAILGTNTTRLGRCGS